ncbi:uncharacterized protein LOC106876348 [Octopus bimaculoides]|nr:uncharacterized protein LOC106876348 [Octopus bimaculoides]|eukprot:XP_014780335.1 PREDICTED: uncharacterized protein LOC106876348 [Octopus bimaculoides]
MTYRHWMFFQNQNNILGTLKAANAIVNLAPAANDDRNNQQNVLMPPKEVAMAAFVGSNKIQSVAPALPANIVHESNKEIPNAEGVNSNSLKNINSSNNIDKDNNAHH